MSIEQIYDFQSLFFQKSSFIQNVLEQNPTVSDLNSLLRNSVDATRADSLFTKLAVRNAVKKRYSFAQNDTTIHDILKTNSGTIILRSSLSNDISYKIQENVFSVLGKTERKHAIQVILENKENLKEEIIRDIVANYEAMYTLDPKACILEIGVTLPKLFSYLDFNSDMHQINEFLRNLVADLKDELKVRDIPYITGTAVESTSLGKGQERIYYEIIQALAEQLPKEKTHIVTPKPMEQKGLIGMMEYETKNVEMYRKKAFAEIDKQIDLWEMYEESKEKQMKQESSKYSMLSDQYFHMSKEHLRAKNCYQKILSERQ